MSKFSILQVEAGSVSANAKKPGSTEGIPRQEAPETR